MALHGQNPVKMALSTRGFEGKIKSLVNETSASSEKKQLKGGLDFLSGSKATKPLNFSRTRRIVHGGGLGGKQ